MRMQEDSCNDVRGLRIPGYLERTERHIHLVYESILGRAYYGVTNLQLSKVCNKHFLRFGIARNTNLRCIHGYG